MTSLKVKDQYRTNPLSLKPGGFSVTAIHETGRVFIYDKVKNPSSYIRRMCLEESEHGAIIEVLVDDQSVWTANCGREIWEI